MARKFDDNYKFYGLSKLLEERKLTDFKFVTESWKTVPNHTFLFYNIYYRNMNSITFSILFHNIKWNLMLKLLKVYNKYPGNTYA